METTSVNKEALFSFGIIADVQYADKEDGGEFNPMTTWGRKRLGYDFINLIWLSRNWKRK